MYGWGKMGWGFDFGKVDWVGRGKGVEGWEGACMASVQKTVMTFF